MLLVAFFAAYLVDKRELLTQGRVRIGRMVPARRCATSARCCSRGASRSLVLAYEKDIGTSLLFFGVFAAMLYMATRRVAYLVGTLVLLVDRRVRRVQRVRSRAACASTPGSTRGRTRSGNGFQIIQGWYAFGSGGIAGTGLGLGNPELSPERVDRLRVLRDR